MLQRFQLQGVLPPDSPPGASPLGAPPQTHIWANSPALAVTRAQPPQCNILASPLIEFSEFLSTLYVGIPAYYGAVTQPGSGDKVGTEGLGDFCPQTLCAHPTEVPQWGPRAKPRQGSGAPEARYAYTICSGQRNIDSYSYSYSFICERGLTMTFIRKCTSMYRRVAELTKQKKKKHNTQVKDRYLSLIHI